MTSNAELDRLIAELGRHPLAEGELREVKEAVFVSLNQSQPEGIEYAFCLSSGGHAREERRRAGVCGMEQPHPLEKLIKHQGACYQ
jgi:hypothetical protein